MEYKSITPNIGVQNVNDTVNFYTEILGFNLIMSNPESGDLIWAMVVSGDTALMFQERKSLEDEYPKLTGRSMQPLLTFYVKMKNMRELYEKLKGTSCIVKELNKTFYGAEEFAIADNNGYILTITEE